MRVVLIQVPLMKEPGLASFDEVWDMTGMKDYVYFEDSGEG